eukprot:TRINITY_DN3467_c0_g1_i1.p1 TRINITY_DN3467_c0_g1~~TRINITY_DN3467_c0_g1_i1.p1  ORF type:complete len:121 (+),score=27.37 TRINITY_DN3467_c0_g1_i1:61-423(+)
MCIRDRYMGYRIMGCQESREDHKKDWADEEKSAKMKEWQRQNPAPSKRGDDKEVKIERVLNEPLLPEKTTLKKEESNFDEPPPAVEKKTVRKKDVQSFLTKSPNLWRTRKKKKKKKSTLR